METELSSPGQTSTLLGLLKMAAGADLGSIDDAPGTDTAAVAPTAEDGAGASAADAPDDGMTTVTTTSHFYPSPECRRDVVWSAGGRCSGSILSWSLVNIWSTVGSRAGHGIVAIGVEASTPAGTASIVVCVGANTDVSKFVPQVKPEAKHGV